MSFNYHSERWKLLRKRILKRDENLCQESLRFGKRVQAVTVHHCFPAEQFPEFAYCSWNLVALSIKQHNRMHVRDTDELTELGEYWKRRAELRRAEQPRPFS